VPGRQPHGALPVQPCEGAEPGLVLFRVGTFRSCCFISDSAITCAVQGLPDVLEQAMRVYAIGGALLIVLIELELERLLWLFRFAEYWIGRAQIQVLHLDILLGRHQTSKETLFVKTTYFCLSSGLCGTCACSQEAFELRDANRVLLSWAN